MANKGISQKGGSITANSIAVGKGASIVVNESGGNEAEKSSKANDGSGRPVSVAADERFKAIQFVLVVLAPLQTPSAPIAVFMVALAVLLAGFMGVSWKHAFIIAGIYGGLMLALVLGIAHLVR